MEMSKERGINADYSTIHDEQWLRMNASEQQIISPFFKYFLFNRIRFGMIV